MIFEAAQQANKAHRQRQYPEGTTPVLLVATIQRFRAYKEPDFSDPPFPPSTYKAEKLRRRSSDFGKKFSVRDQLIFQKLLWRFDWVKLGQRHGVGGDRASRSSGWAVLVGPPGVPTCARTPSVNRRRPLHGTLARHDGAVR